jgi:hypothetical protein
MGSMIDMKKIVEEDPAFKAFASEVALYTLLSTQQSQAFIASLWSFYQSGMSVKQVQDWVAMMNRMNPEDNNNPFGDSNG